MSYQFVGSSGTVPNHLKNKVEELGRDRRGDLSIDTLSQIMSAAMLVLMENFTEAELEAYNEAILSLFGDDDEPGHLN